MGWAMIAAERAWFENWDIANEYLIKKPKLPARIS